MWWKFASPSCVCFISFGFLLAMTCVWVWMVCSLHSVTTGSRDRANVPLKIIIIIAVVPGMYLRGLVFLQFHFGGECPRGSLTDD